MARNFQASILAIFLLTGCGVLPASGPYSSDMDGSGAVHVQNPTKQTAPEFKYALVDISDAVIKKFPEQKNRKDVAWPKSSQVSVIGASVGDTIAVTVYESQAGGLFIPAEAGVRPGNFVTIPAQTVDKSGIIVVPFAGPIKVVGRSTNAIADEITEKLGSRAIDPQVVVSITNRVGAEASVIGEVNQATRFSIGLDGERILDAIARAGGPRYPGYEMSVTLQRQGKEWTIPFDDLISNPAKNIYLASKDTVYVSREPETFQVYGAAGLNGNYSFGKARISLSEALGIARGLEDGQADPEEVYIYRKEDTALLKKMDIDAIELDGKGELEFPVIYKFNLRKSDGFFLAQNFQMQKNDVVYIANAEAVEFVKFLNLINPTSVTKINTNQAITE